MSEYEPDEALLLGLKRIELDATNAVLGLPFPGSDLFKVLDLQEWKYRLVIDVMHEVAAKAKSAHTREWMKGKD